MTQPDADAELRQAVMESAIASGLAPCAPAPRPSRWVLSTFLSQLGRHGYEIKDATERIGKQ